MKRNHYLWAVPALFFLSCQSYYFTTNSPLQETVDKKVGWEQDVASIPDMVLGDSAVVRASGGASLSSNPAGLSASHHWTVDGAFDLRYESERVNEGDFLPQANFLNLNRYYATLSSPGIKLLHFAGGSYLAYDLTYKLEPGGDKHVKYDGGIRAYSAGLGIGPWKNLSLGISADYLHGGQTVDIVGDGVDRNENYSFSGYRLRAGMQFASKIPGSNLSLAIGASIIPWGILNRSGDMEERLELPLRWQFGLALAHKRLVGYLGLGQTLWTRTTSTIPEQEKLYRDRYANYISYTAGVEFPNLIPETSLFFGYQVSALPTKSDTGETIPIKSVALGAMHNPADGKGWGWEVAGIYYGYGDIDADVFSGNGSELLLGVSWGF
jgi:hypothetical protein